MLARITVWERSAPYDEIDFEGGGGFDIDVDYEKVYTIEIDANDLADSGLKLNALIQDQLNAYGLSEWEGGHVAYDPDGMDMAADADGTMTERYAHVEVF